LFHRTGKKKRRLKTGGYPDNQNKKQKEVLTEPIKKQGLKQDGVTVGQNTKTNLQIRWGATQPKKGG